uniref:Ribosome biogenesis protein WDR12 homolog n=1 Tax=Rhabditophanes sp. KR3021 TaxID=114890 RepID=A0AC35THE0_9BILA
MTDNPHVSVLFFSNDPLYSSIPDKVFNLPTNGNVQNLNVLVNQLLSEEKDEWNGVTFDFLVEKAIISDTLQEFIEENEICIEGVLKIECIGKENPPRPDKDMPHNDWVSSVKVSDKYIFSATYDGNLNIWDHDGTNLQKKEYSLQPIKCMAFNGQDGKYRVVLGLQDQTLAVNEVTIKNGKVNVDVTAILRGHERSVDCVAMSGDGSKVVSGSYDKSLKVWDVLPDAKTDFAKTNTDAKKSKLSTVTRTPLVTLLSHKEAITGVAWSPLNKNQVTTVSLDHSIILWDLDSASQSAHLGSNKSFTCVAANPTTGMILTGSVDPVTRLWDLRSKEGAMVKCSFQSHIGWVTAVDWCKTRDHLFITASHDKVVKMWDVRSPKANLYNMIGHEDRILCADWSNSELIASGGVDATVKTFRR